MIEILWTSVRALIPKWPYLRWALPRFTLWQALRSYVGVVFGGHAMVPAGRLFVYLRSDTVDLLVYDEIFRTDEYAIDLPAEPRFIVDAGAHIGLASVFFAQRYPNARIVAIELDRNNFTMLKKNTAGLTNVEAIHAGLHSRAVSLAVHNPTAETWAFRATEGGDIPGITVREVRSNNNVDVIDLLKIDIEGGEKELLDHSADWIDSVKTMIIELHDRYVAGCTEALEKAIAGRAFKRFVSGESTVLIREA